MGAESCADAGAVNTAPLHASPSRNRRRSIGRCYAASHPAQPRLHHLGRLHGHQVPHSHRARNGQKRCVSGSPRRYWRPALPFRPAMPRGLLEGAVVPRDVEHHGDARGVAMIPSRKPAAGAAIWPWNQLSAALSSPENSTTTWSDKNESAFLTHGVENGAALVASISVLVCIPRNSTNEDRNGE
jgi:hypothetical protein